MRMAVFRSLFLMLGALAVLTLGALSAPAPAGAGAPPCHETSHSQDAPGGGPTPEKPTKPMGCCIACVTTIAPEPPIRHALVLPAPVRDATPALLPRGEILSPEPHPPRPINA
jgi:hypothetical protein